MAAARGVLRLSWPMAAGEVASWADMEALWTAAVVGVLGADPAAHPLLLTEAAGSSRAHRRALVGAALEALGAPRVYVGLPPVLALYATGRLGGVGVDVGDTVTQVVPVVDGYVVAGGVRRVDLGGRDVTTRLVGLLRKSGHTFATTAEREVVREMKEACCYVAANPRLDTFVSLAAAPPTVYTLPDGQEIPLTAERSLAPEALFTPSLVGSEAPGLPALIAEAVDASPLDARRRLWSSVLLSGGSTLYRGFGGRLLGDLAARTRPSVRVRVAAPAERRYLPFIGGSLVANLSTFRGMCVGAAEWREEGERVLFKKTFTGAPF